tara:strand:+ start:110 stop:229 length:120 start_codon:yes stop_codon:yes gene_type:complete
MALLEVVSVRRPHSAMFSQTMVQIVQQQMNRTDNVVEQI